MEWYKNLDINKKINAKECFILLCGVGFSEVGIIVPLRERIDLMYDKLKIEHSKRCGMSVILPKLPHALATSLLLLASGYYILSIWSARFAHLPLFYCP